MATASDGARFQVGDVRITRLTEVVFTSFAPNFLLPDWDDETAAVHRHWMTPQALNADGTALVVLVNSWIVQTPGKLLVIDTGIGDGRVRRIDAFNNLRTGYLERMKAAGFDPRSVDYVLCTHLHSDHVGWNTHWSDGRWAPTFPNARYLWSRTENETASSESFRNSLAAGVYEDSVLPIIEAGLVDIVDDGGGEVLEGVTFHPTAGHTPGHMSISVGSNDGQAFFSGDVVHSPIQIHLPHWNSAFCESPASARAARLWALEYAAEHAALFLPAHFGGSSAGRITRRGERFYWSFA